MFAILTSVTGLAAVGGYVYVAVMFGRASAKAGNSIGRVIIDAATWPIMGWQALEDLYRVDSKM